MAIYWSQFKVHINERTQVYGARSSLVMVTHPSTNRSRLVITAVNESLSKQWSPQWHKYPGIAWYSLIQCKPWIERCRMQCYSEFLGLFLKADLCQQQPQHIFGGRQLDDCPVCYPPIPSIGQLRRWTEAMQTVWPIKSLFASLSLESPKTLVSQKVNSTLVALNSRNVRHCNARPTDNFAGKCVSY